MRHGRRSYDPARAEILAWIFGLAHNVLSGHFRTRKRAAGRGIHLGLLACGDEGLLGEGADAECWDSSVPSASVIFCVALWVAKQYHGSPRSQVRLLPHPARQFNTTKSPGATAVTRLPTACTSWGMDSSDGGGGGRT